jgi:hypothetical protein
MKKIPRKYKLENVSLIDDFTYDYYHPDIVNYILGDGQCEDELITADQLNDAQRDLLIGILMEVIKEQKKKIEKIHNIITN